MHVYVHDYRVTDEESDSDSTIIARMLEENSIEINSTDHKMLKYYTVKVKGLFTCKCGHRWSSHKTTVKIDLLRKRVTKVYKQKCKRCRKRPWVHPSFDLVHVMETVITKYNERRQKSLNSDDQVNGDSTLVDSDTQKEVTQDDLMNNHCVKDV